MNHNRDHAIHAGRLALLSTLAALLLAGCDRKPSKADTENNSEAGAEHSSRSDSGATSVDGGFASPEEVFEAMKKLPLYEDGPLFTSEDRVILSYMHVMYAYVLHQFEQDTNRKRAIEEGVEELLAKYGLTDKLEITENDEKSEEDAIRAFGDVDTIAFLSDLGTFVRKFVPGEEMRPVSIRELAVEGDRAEAMVVFSDGTEEREVFVRSGGRWFLSARSRLYPEEEGQSTGSPEDPIEVSLGVNRREEPVRRAPPKLAYVRGADVNKVDLSFVLEPRAQKIRPWLIGGEEIAAKFVDALMVNHVPTLLLESPQGERREYSAWRLAPREIAHAQQFTGLALAPLSELEQWTAGDGRKMSARLIGATPEGLYVFVLKNGERFNIAQDEFAPASQKRIAKLEQEGTLVHLEHVAANASQEKQKEAALYRLITLLAAKNAWKDVYERAKQYLTTEGYPRYAGAVSLALAQSYEHRAMREDAIAAYSMAYGAHAGQIDVSAPAVARMMDLIWKRNRGGDRQIAYKLGAGYRKSTAHLVNQMTAEEKLLWKVVNDLVEQYEHTPGIEKIADLKSGKTGEKD